MVPGTSTLHKLQAFLSDASQASSSAILPRRLRSSLIQECLVYVESAKNLVPGYNGIYEYQHWQASRDRHVQIKYEGKGRPTCGRDVGVMSLTCRHGAIRISLTTTAAAAAVSATQLCGTQTLSDSLFTFRSLWDEGAMEQTDGLP